MTISSRLLFAGLLSLTAVLTARADDWPQWMGPGRDDVWHEKGILDKFPADGPKALWRTKIGWGYAGPSVADGLVYVADFVTKGDLKKLSNPAARPKLKGKERVLCLDAKTGNEVWKHEYDCTYEISYPGGPRCTPAVHDGKVYSLGAEGNLYCLDAKKGTVLWSKHFKKDYEAKTPFWGFAGHPLVDGKAVYCVVGGKGSAVVAFNKDSGKELWKALDSEDAGYSPPTLISVGGKKQLVVWLPKGISSLDPQSGKPLWSVELIPSYGMSIAAPRKQGDYLFTGGIGWKALLLKLDKDKPAAEEVWRGKRDTAVYPVNSTPFIEDGTIYGVDQPGLLRGVDLVSGKRLWETAKPTTGDKPASSATAFLIKNGDRFFLFAETGDLIIARLSRKGYEEISRCKLIEPTNNGFGRDVVWSHPAFARKCVFARNDKEIVCASLAK
jgi:outer membrane protein assembly factor BamB